MYSRRVILAATVGGLVGSTIRASAQGPLDYVSPPEYQPKNWLAFVGVLVEDLQRFEQVRDRTPLTIVYKDGRVVWRDLDRPAVEGRSDREVWREGRLDGVSMKNLVEALSNSTYFTEGIPPGTPGLRPFGPHRTTVGISIAGRSRVVSLYNLPRLADRGLPRPHITSMATMRDTILAARPAKSRRYEPEAIRVAFRVAEKDEAANTVWPIAGEIVDARGIARFYTGEKAHKVVEALSRGSVFEYQNPNFRPIPRLPGGPARIRAEWAPAIEYPVPPPEAK